MPKGKITKSTFTNEWKGDKGTVYYHDIEMDNGDTGSIGSKDKNPDFIAVGQTLDYTLEQGQRGNKIKRNKPAFTPKGGKQLMHFDNIKRMVSSNALHAICFINSESEKELIPLSDARLIEEFTMYDITGDIEKWGTRHDHLITRMACVNNAAAAVKWKNYRNVSDFVVFCKSLAKECFTR
jgi:hypothetical protein